MEDNKIVELFWTRDESAIRETGEKYGRYCHYIAFRILGSDPDAEETVNDTLLKTWNTIPDNRPSDLKAYVGMISRQLALNKYKSNRSGSAMTANAAFEEISECIADPDGEADITDEIALIECLNLFLWSLPEKKRNIFMRRYWYASSISEIAKDFSMKESAVSMLLHRMRTSLKEILERNGFNV